MDTPSTATALDVPPGARPSLLSPREPWAGPGPTPASASTGSPLHEAPPPPSPRQRPGTALPAPTAFGPIATAEDLLASHPSPSDAAALPPALAEPGPEALPSAVPLDQPPGTAPATTFPGAAGSTKPALDWLMREGGELPEADEWTGGDTPAFSTSTLLSGDGDSAEHEGPPAPLILLSSLDYQYDTPGLWELVRPGPGRRPQGRGLGQMQPLGHLAILQGKDGGEGAVRCLTLAWPRGSAWERAEAAGGLHRLPGAWCLQGTTSGPGSCPCVESVQGSSLMPVHVPREVRLLGRNLHLFQVSVSSLQLLLWSPWLLANYARVPGSRKGHGLGSQSQPGDCAGALRGSPGLAPEAAPVAVSSVPRTAQETMSV